MGDFLVKKTLFNEGKYSLGNSSTLPINCDIEMKYLWQWIVTKISGFRMFSNTPLFHPCQNPPTYPLYNLQAIKTEKARQKIKAGQDQLRKSNLSSPPI
jgi:hypothetical protein